MKTKNRGLTTLYFSLMLVSLVGLLGVVGLVSLKYVKRVDEFRKLEAEFAEYQDSSAAIIYKLRAVAQDYKSSLHRCKAVIREESLESEYVEDTQYNRCRLAQELYEVGGFEGRAWDSYLAVKCDTMQALAKGLNISLEEVGKCVATWVHKDLGFGGHKRLMTEWFMKIYTTQDMQEYIRFCKSSAGKKHQIKQYKEITMAVVFIEKKGASRKAQRQLRARLVEAALKK